MLKFEITEKISLVTKYSKGEIFNYYIPFLIKRLEFETDIIINDSFRNHRFCN